jgi:hypothetical protein
LPFQGPAEFTSATEGWSVGDPFAGSAELRHSVDGGRTWRRVPLPISRHVIALGLPTFTGSTGVLPATFHEDHRWGVEFLTTHNDGSWRRAATVRFARNAISRLGVTGIAGPRAWWVANANGHIVRTANAGASWHRMAPPNDDPVVSLSPVDGRNAWAITRHGQRDGLWRTTDGGHTWKRVTPSERGRGPASADVRSVGTLPGPAGDLVAGPAGSVYATYGRGHDRRRSSIARFDPATRAVTHSRSFRGESLGAQHLAIADGSVWFASGRFTHRGTLVRLDAGSLRVLDIIRFPDPVVGVVSTPAGLWVGTARSVMLLDPGTGAIERRVPAGGHVRVLDADPSGEHLYVSTDTPIDHRDHVRFVEMDAGTGAVLAAPRDVGFADLSGPNGVTATDGGVWLATPTGMLGSLTFRRTGDLAQVALYRPGGSNGISSSFAGGTLWVPNLRGGLTCADPVTGAVRGFVGAPTENLGPTNVVASAGGLYVAGAGGSIDRILPDGRCIV